jgi:hypothetical protein
MSNGWLILLLCIAVAIIVTLIILGVNSSDSDTKTVKKFLYKTCKNNFDCETGYHCELRDHPTDGICVIPPGGACYKAPGEKSSACYSGYYCDEQDGVCLKK